MAVGELKKMLEKYPDDMEVLNGRRSDYAVVEEYEWHVVSGVPRPEHEYVMRAHPTMSDENKANCREYLCLEGN